MKWLEPLMPVRFDGNEIYALVVTALIVAFAIYLRKNDPQMLLLEIIFVWLFNLFYSSLGDFFLALPPYDFYDTVDHNSEELMDMLLQNIGYPCFAILSVHFYLKYKPVKLYFVGYVLLVDLITIVLETVGAKYFHLYTYKNWNVFYSFLFYIPVYLLNFWLIHMVRSYLAKKTNAHV